MALVLGLSLALAVFEVGARLLLGEARPPQRRYVISAGALVRDECGAVHYAASRQLRSAAVYGDQVAYDLRFQTNNLGYVADRDYEPREKHAPRERRIAIVGDSFTAGFHGGGGSWVSGLEASLAEEVPAIRLFNLGVGATGLAHFRTRLRCANASLDFDEIVIAAISDDFTRAEWWPLERGDHIHLCLPGEESASCLERTPLIQIFHDSGQSIDTLPANPDTPSPKAWLRDRTHIGQTLLRLRDLFRPSRKLNSEAYSEILRGIRSDLPSLPITLLHLAEKSEVRAGVYRMKADRVDTRADPDGTPADVATGSEFGDVAERAGLRYYPALDRCEFDEDGFHRLDDHPNRKGYDQLALCVRSLLLGGP